MKTRRFSYQLPKVLRKSLHLLTVLFFIFSPFMLVTNTAKAEPVVAIPDVRIKISGNAGAPGIILNYVDGSVKTATADSSGNYSINVPYGWSGRVTPSPIGYTFSPLYREYFNLVANQTAQNYVATAITFTISGNAGLAGAALSYTDGTPKTATADGLGNYSFTVSYNWSGTVTPSYTAYSFTPASRTYSHVLADQTTQDYTAALITYTISGNAGVAGATLSYTDGALKTVTADAWGVYSLTVSYNWSGTVTPYFAGYTFMPASRTYSNVLADKSAENYTVGTSAKTYYVDNTNLSCSDSGTGTSPTLPFCTIYKATTRAIAGDTIRVLAGVYAETVKPKPGIAGYPVTVSAAPDVTVTGLAGNSTNGGAFRLTTKSFIVVDGFNVTGTADYGIYMFGSNHITITNNHVSYAGSPVSGSTRAGIFLDSTTDTLISNNTSDHNSFAGIHLIECTNVTISDNTSFANAVQISRSASGIELIRSSNNTIIHNFTYANEDTGINLYTDSSYNNVIENVTYGNGDHGIDNNASPHNIIIGNTVQGNVTVGINLEGAVAPGSGGATVMNNILVDNGLRLQVGGGIATEGSPGNIRVDAKSMTGTILDYNLYYLSNPDAGAVQILYEPNWYNTLADFKSAVPGQETHGLQNNPLLIAPAPPAERPTAAPYNVAVNMGDYHIAAGSPAIDSANADAPGEPFFDMDGNMRVDDFQVANTGSGIRTYDDRGAYEYQPPWSKIYIPIILK